MHQAVEYASYLGNKKDSIYTTSEDGSSTIKRKVMFIPQDEAEVENADNQYDIGEDTNLEQMA